jgi:hypothetical protein
MCLPSGCNEVEIADRRRIQRRDDARVAGLRDRRSHAGSDQLGAELRPGARYVAVDGARDSQGDSERRNKSPARHKLVQAAVSHFT